MGKKKIVGPLEFTKKLPRKPEEAKETVEVVLCSKPLLSLVLRTLGNWPVCLCHVKSQECAKCDFAQNPNVKYMLKLLRILDILHYSFKTGFVDSVRHLDKKLPKSPCV